MRAAFKAAWPYSIPVLCGYVPLGIGFGILMEKAGYGFWWVASSSVFILSGTGQYISVEFLNSLATLTEIILVMLVLNFRYMFYALSFIERFQGIGLRKWYIAFGLTDETYAILTATKTPEGIKDKDFMVALAALNHLYWIIGSVMGVFLGKLLTFDFTGVDFIMTSMFVVLSMDQWKNSPSYEPALVGLIIGVIALIIFGPSNFMMPALIAITAVLILRRKPIEKHAAAAKRRELETEFAKIRSEMKNASQTGASEIQEEKNDLAESASDMKSDAKTDVLGAKEAKCDSQCSLFAGDSERRDG